MRTLVALLLSLGCSMPQTIDGDLMVLIGGQSNARSAAHADEMADQTLNAVNEDVQFFEQNCASSDPEWIYYPTSGEGTLLQPRTGGRFGVELSMGRRLVEEYGDHLAIVKFSVNGSNLASQWLPSSNPMAGHSSNLFTQMVALIRAKERALHATFAGFVWIQGNGDAAVQAKAEAYEANLTTLLAALRAATHDEIVMVLDQYPTVFTDTYASTLRAQQAQFVSRARAVAMVDTSTLSSADGAHYTNQSYVDLGYLLADALIAAP